MEKLKNLNKKLALDRLISLSASIAENILPRKNTHNSKYTYTNIFEALYHFIYSGYKWVAYSGTKNVQINGKYLSSRKKYI